MSPGILNPPASESLDPDAREAAIETITQYARAANDQYLLELVGFNAARTDVTDEMEAAVVVAVLPLLSDERLNFLMRHIAEVSVERLAKRSRRSR